MATVLSNFWRKDWKVPLAKNFETSWQKCVAFSSGHTGAFTLRASLKITVQRNKKSLKHLQDKISKAFKRYRKKVILVFQDSLLQMFFRLCHLLLLYAVTAAIDGTKLNPRANLI